MTATENVPPVDPGNSSPIQPADSKIVFIPGEALTFSVPHMGFRGPALFFMIFALIWDIPTFICFAAFVVMLIHDPSFEDVLILLFLSLFVGVGILMPLAGIQTAYRKSVIVAARDILIYTQTGPLRKFECQWKPEQIAAIRVDFSGTTINNRRLTEVQVHDTAGNKRGFFDGRDDAELQWLATMLRGFYNVPERAASRD